MDQVKAPFHVTISHKACQIPGYYVWDSGAIYAEGKYHLFVSAWEEKYGFGWNWLLRSKIIHCVSSSPFGPFEYHDTALSPRGRQYFDGMSTHNSSIKYWNGTYYLFYMGCTFGGPLPDSGNLDPVLANEIWNRKRIGLATSKSLDGPWVRRDVPLLEPRDCSHWDCTITTNPSAAILPDGTTYMIYKSRRDTHAPLQLGLAKAPRPEGPYERFSDDPILQFDNPNKHIEDPFLWYDEKRKRFCLIAKDDPMNKDPGITGVWGAGFYAESEDGKSFQIAENPLVYTRDAHWPDGRITPQANMERPTVLFDEKGQPICLYCATGDGATYSFSGTTYVLAWELEK